MEKHIEILKERFLNDSLMALATIDFTSTEAITSTTPMDNISGSYRLEDGKLIATFDISILLSYNMIYQ